MFMARLSKQLIFTILIIFIALLFPAGFINSMENNTNVITSNLTLISRDGVLQNDSLNVEYVAPEDGSIRQGSITFSTPIANGTTTHPASCSKAPIDTGENSQWFPAISERYIVYQEDYLFPWDITLYDLSARRKQRLTDVLNNGKKRNYFSKRFGVSSFFSRHSLANRRLRFLFRYR